MKEKTRIKKFTLMKDISPLDEILFAVVVLFMFFTMFYADLTVTAQYSLTLIDSLFDGKFASFYQNAMASGIAPEGAVYDIGIYLVFAVWGFPVWVLRMLFGVSVLSAGSLLWYKFLLILFAVGNGIVVEKIAKELKIAAESRSMFLFTSLLFNFPILVAAQYDVVPLFFILLGTLQSIRKNRKGFLLYFSLAFTMKPFALLPFLIILLLEEKNIVGIVVNGIISVIPLGVCKLIYMVNPVNIDSNNSFLADMFPKLVEVQMNVGNGSVSVFALFLLIVCASAYCFKPRQDTAEDGRWLIWFLYLGWCGFCMFVPIYPYWIIYLAPFLALVNAYDETRTNFMGFLDLAANVGVILIMIYRYSWVYGGENTFRYLILKFLPQVADQSHSVGSILFKLHFDMFETVIFAVVFAAFGVIGYIAYGGLRRGRIENVPVQKIHNCQWKIRIGMLYGWSLLCILLVLV